MVDVSDLPEGDLLLSAWPEDGPAAEDVELLRKLPVQERLTVVRRLETLLRFEAAKKGELPGRLDKARAAASLGLSPQGLLLIRKKWAASRRIASIVPYLGRSTPTVGRKDDDGEALELVRRLVAARPDDADSAIASDVARATRHSEPYCLRIVRRVRREAATDPRRIRHTFGQTVVVDLCAVDRVTTDEPPRAIVCALAAEGASGLILGHAVVASGDDTLSAQAEAARAAVAWLADRSMDPAGSPSEVVLGLGDGPKLEAALADVIAIRALPVAVRPLDVRTTGVGSRRHGQRVIALIGQRLGSLWWRPRGTAPGVVPQDGGAMTVPDAALLIAEQVGVHNAAVMERLAAGGVTTDWAERAGAMTRALELVAALIDPADPDAGRLTRTRARTMLGRAGRHVQPRSPTRASRGPSGDGSKSSHEGGESEWIEIDEG